MPDGGLVSNRFNTTAQIWDVPDSGQSQGYFATSFSTQWTTMDLTGDGRPELVVPTNSGTVWGAPAFPYWKVYLPIIRGTNPDAFSASATPWALPVATWVRPGSNWVFTTMSIYDLWFSTFDIDGDGRADLVHTGNSTQDPSQVWGAGTANMYWKIYRGVSPSGFSTTALTWPVPASGLADGFHAANINTAPKSWFTRDLNGDGRPDLVQTMNPAFSQVWATGGGLMYWKVWLNTGSGFSSTVTTWTVPSSGTPEGFATPSSATGTRHWVLLDMNGDAKPDLVQTADNVTGATWGAASGTMTWKVFVNTGTGFSTTAFAWPVPPNGFAEGFFDVASSTSAHYWTTIDIDGDRYPDLVHTGDIVQPAAVWGTALASYWKVFKNTGAGFSMTPINWPVPPSGTAGGFYVAEKNVSNTCWSLLDMNGDGRIDLVQSADFARGPYPFDAATNPNWHVFFGAP